jgi:hypothetical protein
VIPVINRDARDRLAILILELQAGYIKLGDFVSELFSLPEDDAAIHEIGRQVAIDAEIDIDPPSRMFRWNLLRIVLFLRTDREYEYGQLPRMDCQSCLLTLLTGGLGFIFWYTFNYPKIRAVRRRWGSGDVSVWPFYRKSDFDAEYAKSCPFARAKAA